MRIVVAIPSRGLDALLAVCVEHARRALDRLGTDGAIIVVDNASAVPYAPDAIAGADQVLRFDQHRSFSAAVNAAVAADPAADHVLLLNNDVLLHGDALRHMVALLDEPLVALVGTRLVFPDGTIQHCGVVFDDDGPFHERWGERSDAVSRAPRLDLQSATAAALIVRRSLYDALGGLDEAYPNGFEDVDLCLRARRLGYRVACAQAVDSIHFQSTTPGRHRFEEASLAVFRGHWQGRVAADSMPRLLRG